MEYNSDKCPYCYRKKGTWQNDPILLPNGAVYNWNSDVNLHKEPDIKKRHYKGINKISQECQEIQDALKDLEEAYLKVEQYTKFSPLIDENNSKAFFQVKGIHIKEMRESIEKILGSLGMTKTTYFNYDAEGNHIIHPLGDKTDWTDAVVKDEDWDNFQVKAIHIEDLRHFQSIWENFTPGGSGSVSATGTRIGDTHLFQNLKKCQLWTGTAHAGLSWYNTGDSSSSVSVSITNAGSATAIAAGVAEPGYAPGPYWSTGGSTGDIGATMPLKISGPSGEEIQEMNQDYPLIKYNYDPITHKTFEYHLYVKADCSINLSVGGGYTNGATGLYYLGMGLNPNYYPIQEGDAIWTWNQNPVDGDTTAHRAHAYVSINIGIRFYPTGGLILSLSEDKYQNTDGIPPLQPSNITMNNFDVDIYQKMIDVFGYAAGYASGFGITAGAGGEGNANTRKNGVAEWIDDPLIPGDVHVLWYGPVQNAGGYGTASASFVIDNINFYYKISKIY